MSKSKYVTGIYRDFANRNAWKDTHVAIVFPETVVHADMEHLFVKIISAGFVDIEGETPSGYVNVYCYGRSESLEVDSKPGDDVLVRKALSLSLDI